MSDIYTVITPENVELDYEIAGIGSRFLASGIDLLIQALLFIGVAYALRLLNLGRLDAAIKNYFSSIVGGIIILCGVLVIFLGYYIILETVWNGQTLGKRLIHIRVRKEGGYAPSFWDILLRNIIRLIDLFPFFYCTGLIVMFLNNKSKRLGDYAAATIVVKELPRKQFSRFLANSLDSANSEYLADSRKLPFRSEQTSLFHPVAAPETVDLGLGNVITSDYPWLNGIIPLISEADYFMMKELLSRRAVLVNYPALAATILGRIIARTGNPPAQPQPNEALAAEIIPQLIQLYEKMTYGVK